MFSASPGLFLEHLHTLLSRKSVKVREATGSGREPCRTCLASLTHPSLVLHRQRGTWGRACARAPSPGPHAYADDQACTPAPRALRIPMASPLPPPSKGSGGPNLQSWGLSTASHAYTDGQPSAPHLYHRGPWGSKPPVPGAVTPGPASEPRTPAEDGLPWRRTASPSSMAQWSKAWGLEPGLSTDPSCPFLLCSLEQVTVPL